MDRMELGLDTLKDFDYGKADVAFRQGLRRIVTDCLDRPGEKSARTVTLTMIVVPVMQQDGDVVDAEVEFKIKAKVPDWQTAARPLLTTRSGQLFFNSMAPDNPRQSTIEAARAANAAYAAEQDLDEEGDD